MKFFRPKFFIWFSGFVTFLHTIQMKYKFRKNLYKYLQETLKLKVKIGPPDNLISEVAISTWSNILQPNILKCIKRTNNKKREADTLTTFAKKSNFKHCDASFQ